MAKIRGKIAAVPAGKPRGRAITLSGMSKDPKSEQSVSSGVWKDALCELRQQHFANMETALQAVVDAVAAKMNPAGGDDSEIRKFLYQLLDTDPGLKEDLQRSLRIKS